MSNEIIRADYLTLEQIAQQFERESERIRLVKQSLMRHLDILRSGGWISEAADRLYAEMDEDILPSIQRLEAALLSGGSVSREIIRIFRSAEEEAALQLNPQDEAVVGPASTLFPAGGGSGIVNNDVTSPVTDATTAPEGVTFTGLTFSLLEGIPDETPGAQYQTIDNMSADDKRAADEALDDPATTDTVEGLNNSQDYNSCGPLVIAAMVAYLQGDGTAGNVFSRFVQLNADVANFDPGATTSLRELAPLARDFGLTANYITNGISINSASPDVEPYPSEDMIDLINTELQLNNPVAALINIDQNGIVIDDPLGTNHWIVVTGTGEADDGTQYVQIWNPISDQIEFYEADFFRSSFVSGQNTMASFTNDVDTREDEE